jgi:steroid delta-isomerase
VVDRNAICSICDRYVAAVDAGDVDGVLSLYGDVPVVEDPVGSEPKVGREAVRAHYVASFGGRFSARRIGPVTVVGQRAAFQFRIDVPLGPTTMKLTVTDVMTFDADTRILTMVAYPDGEADPDAVV